MYKQKSGCSRVYTSSNIPSHTVIVPIPYSVTSNTYDEYIIFKGNSLAKMLFFSHFR